MAHPQANPARGGVFDRAYRRLDDFFEHPAVFNAYQAIADGGKFRQIRRFLATVPYESVLDVGSGTGNWAQLARGRYLGIDTSASFIEGCLERYAEDPEKTFLLADAAEIEPAEHYDLGLMISVLHHLSDQKAEAILRRLVTVCRYVFILDLYPIPWNPLARAAYALDRGNFIRSKEEQRRLVQRVEGFHVLKDDDYFSPSLLYRHTLFLLSTPRADRR